MSPFINIWNKKVMNSKFRGLWWVLEQLLMPKIDKISFYKYVCKYNTISDKILRNRLYGLTSSNTVLNTIAVRKTILNFVSLKILYFSFMRIATSPYLSRSRLDNQRYFHDLFKYRWQFVMLEKVYFRSLVSFDLFYCKMDQCRTRYQKQQF